MDVTRALNNVKADFTSYKMRAHSALQKTQVTQYQTQIKEMEEEKAHLVHQLQYLHYL